VDLWYGTSCSAVAGFNLTWRTGSDSTNKDNPKDDVRLVQCYLYARDPEHPDEPDGCHYAFPLPISPVISPVDLSLVRIDHLPTGLDGAVKPLQPMKFGPPNEYIPEAQKQLRIDL
jgi:primary-amine oxidase